MTPIEGVILAAEILAVPLLIYLPNLKGFVIMSSQAFTDALNANTAAWQGKVAEKQTEVDAANARIAELEAQPVVTDTGPQVDAEDTAAVIAATPA